MFSYISNKIYQPLTKEERLKRFPLLEFHTNPVAVRKIGLSTNELSPKHLLEIIETHYKNLDPSNHRYEWLTHWLPLIRTELSELERYTMEDVGRVVIIQNEKSIFEFYIIYDIHIHDVEIVVINLDNTIDEPNILSKIIASFSMIVSIGSLGYLISNII